MGAVLAHWPDLSDGSTVDHVRRGASLGSPVRDASAAELGGMLLDDATVFARQVILSYAGKFPSLGHAHEWNIPLPSDVLGRLGKPYSIGSMTLGADAAPRWSETVERVHFFLLASAGYGSQPEWFASAVETAYELTKLEDGWDGRDGHPATREDALTALRLLRRLTLPSAASPFLHPSPDGGVFIELQLAHSRVTLLVENDLVAVWNSANGYQPETFQLREATAHERDIDRDLDASINAGAPSN